MAQDPAPSTYISNSQLIAPVGVHSGTHAFGGDDPIPVAPYDLGGVFTPPQITGNVNDYQPTESGEHNIWRVSSNSSSNNLTGIRNGSHERVLVLENVGASALNLIQDSASSLAPNRFYLPNDADQVLTAGSAAVFQYDVYSKRWRLISLVVNMAAVNAVIASLDSRLDTLEPVVAANTATLGDHETRIDALEAVTTAHTATLGDHEARLDTAEATIVTHETRIQTLEDYEFSDFLSTGQQLTSNSTTFQNITHLALTLAATSIWVFTVRLLYISTIAADFKFQFTIPAGASLIFDAPNLLQGGVLTPAGSIGASSPVTIDGNGANIFAVLTGTVFCGATPGTLQFQAAQNTATVETTDFVVQGSSIFANRIS